MLKEKDCSRCQWVDIAKGIAIIAVVLLHVDYPWADGRFLPLSLLLGNAWHVNVFFILGGFFLTDEKLSATKSFISHKIKTLYLPLLYFSIPAVLLHNVLIDIGWYDTATDYGGKLIGEWSLGDMLRSLASVFVLAGREPILAALWFLCSLFMALCGLSVISMVVRRFCGRHHTAVMLTVLFLIGVASSLMTNVLGIYIPRFNNALSAMWLIYLGYLLHRVKRCSFDSPHCVVVAFLLFYIGVLLLDVLPFSSFLLQTVIALTALYMVCFIAKRMEFTVSGRFVALCGRESLYIMALQFVAFRLCTELLNLFGCALSPAALMPPTNGSFALLMLYIVAGLALPIIFIHLWRWAGHKIKALF